MQQGELHTLDTRTRTRTISVPRSQRGGGFVIGLPRGEKHWRARLSDAAVDRMRDLYEAGGIGYRKLATLFECPVRTARDIVNYKRR